MLHSSLVQIGPIVSDHSDASRAFYADDVPSGERGQPVGEAHVLNVKRDYPLCTQVPGLCAVRAVGNKPLDSRLPQLGVSISSTAYPPAIPTQAATRASAAVTNTDFTSRSLDFGGRRFKPATLSEPPR